MLHEPIWGAAMITARARFAVIISFILVSIAGAGLIFSYWSSQSLAIANSRSVLFVVIMACVHVAGYILYVQQAETAPAKVPIQRTAFEFSPLYSPAFKNAIVFQLIIGVLTALLLDGGRAFSLFGVAFLSHWIGILIILARRPMTPTKFDLSFIRIGILPLCVLTSLVAPVVWKIIGESHLSGWQRLLGY